MTAIDWTTLMSQSAGSFDPVPNDTYDVVVQEAEATQTQNQKPMIKAKFRIEGGPHDGRALWNQFVVSPENPNALSFFFGHMKVFGMDENFFAQQPSMERIAQTMQGKRCQVVTNIRTWNGQERNEIKTIKPSLGGGPTGLAPAGPGVGAPNTGQPGFPPPAAAAPQPQVAAQPQQQQQQQQQIPQPVAQPQQQQPVAPVPQPQVQQAPQTAETAPQQFPQAAPAQPAYAPPQAAPQPQAPVQQEAPNPAMQVAVDNGWAQQPQQPQQPQFQPPQQQPVAQQPVAPQPVEAQAPPQFAQPQETPEATMENNPAPQPTPAPQPQQGNAF